MPTVGDLKSKVFTLFQDKQLTATEAEEIFSEMDGLSHSKKAKKELLSALRQVFTDHRDELGGSHEAINHLLQKIDDKSAFSLSGPEPTEANGITNWIGAFQLSQGYMGNPSDMASLNNKRMEVSSSGELFLDGEAANLGQPVTETLIETLWGLGQPGAMEGIPVEAQKALVEKLFPLMSELQSVSLEEPDMFERMVALSAATSLLEEVDGSLVLGMADKLLEVASTDPITPLAKNVLLRMLSNVEGLSEGQKEKLDSIEKYEDMDVLLETYDKLKNGKLKQGYSSITKGVQQYTLAGLAFAKKESAIENLIESLEPWRKLNQTYSEPWDSEEIGHMNSILKAYVEEHGKCAYVLGTLKKEAPRKVADLKNIRLQEELQPLFESDPVVLKDIELTPEQVATFKELSLHVEDKSSWDKLVTAFSKSMSKLTAPGMKPGATAVEYFERQSKLLLASVEGSTTGKISLSWNFQTDFNKELRRFSEDISKKLQQLSKTPPVWGDIRVTTEAATFLKELLNNNVRSMMSTENIGRVVSMVAEQHGGFIEQQGFEQLSTIVSEYKSYWPDLETFDFNKLQRIAKFKLQGREVPLSSINGEPATLATFYQNVGTSITEAIDQDSLKYPWAAERWGMRAKQAVELLDVVAEKSARDEGPLAAIKKKYGDVDIDIIARASSGSHDQFLYQFRDSRNRLQTLAVGSDGRMQSISSSAARRDVLFLAQVGSDGQLNVSINNNIRLSKYPLQTTYDIGDKIDIPFYDSSAKEIREKGKTFETRSKVVEAEIVSYTATGSYKVKFTTPQGEERTKTIRINDITEANNPHWFDLDYDRFSSDIIIDIDRDPSLKSFLEGAQPIIDTYLPRDGSLLSLAPAELAARQKDCIKALMKYTRDAMKYPSGKETSHDEKSVKYHEYQEEKPFILGKLLDIGRGVCRHQCILEHLLCQLDGTDSRLPSCSANTSSGNYRGLHIWMELSLADNARYLSDQTWNDAAIPLWDGAYDKDKRRVEMYFRTERYDEEIVR